MNPRDLKGNFRCIGLSIFLASSTNSRYAFLQEISQKGIKESLEGKLQFGSEEQVLGEHCRAPLQLTKTPR